MSVLVIFRFHCRAKKFTAVLRKNKSEMKLPSGDVSSCNAATESLKTSFCWKYIHLHGVVVMDNREAIEERIRE
jgi:hypothetical protein